MAEPRHDATVVDAGVQPTAIEWSSTSARLEPDGRTEPVAFDARDTPAVLGVRAYAESTAVSSTLCFQLEDVVVAGDQTWVPTAAPRDYDDYCETCAQRVGAGAGYGFFGLPSGAEPPIALGEVHLRVALRDCLLLTPLDASAARPGELRVDYAAWRAPASEQELRLRLRVVNASRHALADDPQLLERALVLVREIWAPAAIELSFADVIEIDPEPGPLRYSAEDRRSLVALGARAQEASAAEADWPLLVIAPCLQRDDVLTGGKTEPRALSSHGLGGYAVHGETDAMFVAGERCGGLTPAPEFFEEGTLAAIIAHELGHYLGLYHVAESDGRQDRLVDTSPEQPNLMRAVPSAAATELSRSQIEIARRHMLFASGRMIETHPL